MKVIKRDGRTIEFDRDKIEVAIEKANKEVRGKEKATKAEINEIYRGFRKKENVSRRHSGRYRRKINGT